jgi:hypothetical protein
MKHRVVGTQGERLTKNHLWNMTAFRLKTEYHPVRLRTSACNFLSFKYVCERVTDYSGNQMLVTLADIKEM